MAPAPARPTPSLDLSIVIRAPARLVLHAFFEAGALGAWWQITRSVTSPRPFGPYAIEWKPTDFRDEILGRLGGILRGTVIQFDAARGFFVADVYWLPPDGEPIGPMALEVACTDTTESGGAGSSEPTTRLRVRHTGFEESDRWRRYYEVVGAGWERALKSLKMLLEK